MYCIDFYNNSSQCHFGSIGLSASLWIQPLQSPKNETPFQRLGGSYHCKIHNMSPTEFLLSKTLFPSQLTPDTFTYLKELMEASKLVGLPQLVKTPMSHHVFRLLSFENHDRKTPICGTRSTHVFLQIIPSWPGAWFSISRRCFVLYNPSGDPKHLDRNTNTQTWILHRERVPLNREWGKKIRDFPAGNLQTSQV